MTGATSNGFNIAANTAAKLVFGQQPTSAPAGASLSPAVTVLVQDAYGNMVSGDTSTVTLAIITNPGGGTLAGTATAAAVNSVATFSNLSIDKAGSGYVLTASDGTLSSAASNGFNITTGAAAQLAFSQQPTNALAGVSISPAVTVFILDANGNRVTSDTSSVSLAITTNPPGNGVLAGPRQWRR